MTLAGRAVHADGVLPTIGPDVRVGDLRQLLQPAYDTGIPLAAPGWTVTKAVDVQFGWSDPVQGQGGAQSGVRGDDYYLSVTPSLGISGESRILKGGLFLTPELRGYAKNGRLNSFNNNFSTQMRATVVEDEIYIDVTGYSAQQSRNGGFTQTSALTRNQTVQTTSYTISPVVQHKFDDYGSGQIKASFGQSFTDAQNGQTQTAGTTPVSTQPQSTSSLQGSFTGGQYFNRLQPSFQASTTSMTGAAAGAGGAAGTNPKSLRSNATANADYSISRIWTALTSIGYESISYGAKGGYNYDGATWSGGLRWTPNADSSVTLTYGRREAGNSVSLDGSYAATARLRLTARYSEGIATQQQNTQRALQSSILNASGQFVDPRTGLPIATTNNFLGTQSGAYRFARAGVTASLMGDRNTYSLSLSKDQQTPLTSGGTTGGVNNFGGTTLSLSVQRELNPATTGSVFSQIGQRKTGGATALRGAATSGNQDTFSIGGTLSIVLTQTVTARAQYSFTSNSNASANNAAFGGYPPTQHLFLAGIHKTF